MMSYVSECHQMALIIDIQWFESLDYAVVMTLNDAGIRSYQSVKGQNKGQNQPASEVARAGFSGPGISWVGSPESFQHKNVYR